MKESRIERNCITKKAFRTPPSPSLPSPPKKALSTSPKALCIQILFFNLPHKVSCIHPKKKPTFFERWIRPKKPFVSPGKVAPDGRHNLARAPRNTIWSHGQCDETLLKRVYTSERVLSRICSKISQFVSYLLQNSTT